MSDSVKPGDIAKLALSDDLAYRASFQGKKPDPDQMYWRTMVLENYDGRSWTRAYTSRQQARQIVAGRATYNPIINPVTAQTAAGQAVKNSRLRYQVTAEASYQPWLFSLDLARVNQPGIVHLPDHSLRSKKPLTKTFAYQVVSYTTQPLDINPAQRMLKRNLMYPQGANPRLTQEAYRLRQTHTSDIGIVQAVLANFRQQSYYYTLQPPALDNNSLDQFYFDTKAGFCEHYASAFTYLMRAAGIPARMVIGYLGGEYNEEGDYYSIFQYDAHAWVEIWQPDRGWLRVDPTAAVSPDRVENGLSSRLLQEQSQLSGNLLSLHRYRHLAWINSLRLKLDAMDYQWTRLVLSYSAKRQYDLLENLLGRVLPWKIAAIVVGALCVIFLVFWLVNQGRSQRKAGSPWLRVYQQALVLLAKKGLVKPTAMPAKTFAALAQQALPGLNDCFVLLSNDFESITYQNLDPAQQQQGVIRMKQNLKALKSALKNQANVAANITKSTG
jgi:transglutaminase-like putative cysteine protease